MHCPQRLFSKLTCSDRNNNIELKKTFSWHKGVHMPWEAQIPFPSFTGWIAAKLYFPSWPVGGFCVWDRLSWPEFFPHLPYYPVLPCPRLSLVPRLTRWEVVSLLYASKGRMPDPCPLTPHSYPSDWKDSHSMLPQSTKKPSKKNYIISSCRVTF